MKNRVITISREFGSGGRTIGKRVAEKLDIPCYDAEIIQEMAQETGFAPDHYPADFLRIGRSFVVVPGRRFADLYHCDFLHPTDLS